MPKPRTEAWAIALSKELYRAGGPAEAALRAKCNWEHMSRSAVIMEWGDPRQWRTVVAQGPECPAARARLGAEECVAKHHEWCHCAERDWRTMSIVELAAENPSAMDYIRHWEARCLKAEATLRTLDEQVRSGALGHVTLTASDAEGMRTVNIYLGDAALPAGVGGTLGEAIDAFASLPPAAAPHRESGA
jgi:hypothetical protein